MKILPKIESYFIEKEKIELNPFGLSFEISGDQLNLLNSSYPDYPGLIKGTKLETGNLTVKDFPQVIKEFQPGLDRISKKYLKALEKLQDDFSKEVKIYCDKIEDSVNF